jgi:hypothetical protein
MGTFHLAPEGTIRRGQNERTELRVIAVIRSGVVLLHVDPVVSDTTYRPPRETTEVNNQIRGNVTHCAIGFFGLEYDGA